LIAIVFIVATAIVLRERAQAVESLNKTERIARLAQDAIDKLYVEFANQWIQFQPGQTQQQKKILEQAARYYEELLRDVDDETASVGAVTTLRRLAMTYRFLGDSSSAINSVRRAIDLGDAILEKNPNNHQAQAAVAEALRTLERCEYIDLYKRDSPLRIKLCKRAAGLWESVVQAKPDDLDARERLALSWIDVARAYGDTRQYADADIWADRAYQTMSQLVSSHPEDVGLRDKYVGVLFGYRSTRLEANPGAVTTDGPRSGQRELAQKIHLEAIDNARWLVKHVPNSIPYQAMLASALVNPFAFESERAIAFLTEAIEIEKKLHEQFPDVYQYEDGLRLCYHQIREPLLALGRYDEAISAMREDIAIRERRVRLGRLRGGDREHEVLNIYVMDYQHLFRVLAHLRRDEERQQELLRSRDLLKVGLQLLNGRNDASSALRWRRSLYDALAQVSWQLEDKETASEYARQLIAEHRRCIALVPERERAFAMQWLAWLLVTWPDPELRNPDEAIKLAQEVLAMDGIGDRDKMLTAMVIGLAHLRHGNPTACIEWMEKSNKDYSHKRPSTKAVEWFALSIANHKIGPNPNARGLYQRAAGWMDDALIKEPVHEWSYHALLERPFELDNLRSEAEAPLGISREASATEGQAVKAEN
jgi:tetratricopeptide (TPR) repeat protein